MCAISLKRQEHPKAREVAAWMRPRLIGALREVGGASTAQAVLRRAALQYGPQATQDALTIIHRDVVTAA